MSRTRLLDELARNQRTARIVHPIGGPVWKAARRDNARQLLADAGMLDLDDLDDDERQAVEWVAGWDEDTVAGVARLLQLAYLTGLRRGLP